MSQPVQGNQYPAPPQYGAIPPQQQYIHPPPQQHTVVVGQQPVIAIGGCPLCGGVMRDEFTMVGIILAIIFFPIGILCCLVMTEKRCSNCGR